MTRISQLILQQSKQRSPSTRRRHRRSHILQGRRAMLERPTHQPRAGADLGCAGAPGARRRSAIGGALRPNLSRGHKSNHRAAKRHADGVGQWWVPEAHSRPPARSNAFQRPNHRAARRSPQSLLAGSGSPDIHLVGRRPRSIRVRGQRFLTNAGCLRRAASSTPTTEVYLGD